MEAINKIITSVITWVLIASIGYLFVSISNLQDRVLVLELTLEQAARDLERNEKILQCLQGYGC